MCTCIYRMIDENVGPEIVFIMNERDLFFLLFRILPNK